MFLKFDRVVTCQTRKATKTSRNQQGGGAYALEGNRCNLYSTVCHEAWFCVKFKAGTNFFTYLSMPSVGSTFKSAENCRKGCAVDLQISRYSHNRSSCCAMRAAWCSSIDCQGTECCVWQQWFCHCVWPRCSGLQAQFSTDEWWLQMPPFIHLLCEALGPRKNVPVGTAVDPPKYALGHSYKPGCAVFSSASIATASTTTDAVVRLFQVGKMRSSFAAASRVTFCKVFTGPEVRLPKVGPAHQPTQWCLG